MSGGATWAVVPVKHLDAAKGRLAGALDPAARRELSLSMLGDVLDALEASPGLAGIAVVTRDTRVMELTRERGHRVIAETGTGPNAAITQAARVLAAEGCACLLVLPADLPLAGPEEIAAVLAALPAPTGIAVVPDRHGSGTNAFASSPPAAVAPSFGDDSFARHLAAAREVGVPATVLRLPGLALDIDTPEDLAAFADRPGSTGTHGFLAAEAPACAAGGRS